MLDGLEVPGLVSHAELVAYYRNADVFVCLSEHEGFCVPLVEAMVHRLPIVAYGAAAVPDTIGDAGIVLDSKEPLRGRPRSTGSWVTASYVRRSTVRPGDVCLDVARTFERPLRRGDQLGDLAGLTWRRGSAKTTRGHRSAVRVHRHSRALLGDHLDPPEPHLASISITHFGFGPQKFDASSPRVVPG